MARLARTEVFAPSEIAIVHAMNRDVRRCFLVGDDPISGKNFDLSKVWFEGQLRLRTACFGISAERNAYIEIAAPKPAA